MYTNKYLKIIPKIVIFAFFYALTQTSLWVLTSACNHTPIDYLLITIATIDLAVTAILCCYIVFELA
jgi:hypothetical protein